MTIASRQDSADSGSRQLMLSAANLFCERDDRILFQGLNFEIEEGQVLQITGSNGSGKTTLMRILCGLNDGYRGMISWYGKEISDQIENFYQSLLYIGHRVGVNKVLTPIENLRWSCCLQTQIEDERLMEALSIVGLRGFEESQCFTLSAGQQQRVSLARLLVSPAKLWVLDEPFTTLDLRAVEQLENFVADHAGAGGAVMITTHHDLKITNLNKLDLG
jgi:heme exporter protein A